LYSATGRARRRKWRYIKYTPLPFFKELYFTHMGRKKTLSDLHKNLHWGDIRDIITDANFWDDRLRRFCVARGQILGFSICFRHLPYNTVALPYECVIN